MSDPWNQWSKHVLTELQRHNTALEEVVRELGDIRVEIAVLKTKAAIWGGIAGGVPAAAVLIATIFWS